MAKLSVQDTKINSAIKRYNEQMRTLVKEGLSIQASEVYANWVSAGLDVAITESGMIRIKQNKLNRSIFKRNALKSKTFGRTITQVKQLLKVDSITEAREQDKALDIYMKNKSALEGRLYNWVKANKNAIKRGDLSPEDESTLYDYNVLKNDSGLYNDDDVAEVMKKYGYELGSEFGIYYADKKEKEVLQKYIKEIRSRGERTRRIFRW